MIAGPAGEAGEPADERSSHPWSRRWLKPVRVVLVLAVLALALNWVQKSPCSDGDWQNLEQLTEYCYTDVVALYDQEGLIRGEVPYLDHPVEYPVLTGAFMGIIGLSVHDLIADPFVQFQVFYHLHALILGALGVATVAVVLALRPRRPWDAAMLAVAPGVLLSATVNWDLLVVALTAFGMYFWARSRPVAAGVLLGLAVAAKLYPVLVFGPLLFLGLRTGRLRPVLVALGAATATWLVVNVPVAVANVDNWSTFFTFNRSREIDWGTLWYIGAHFPRGDGRYGIAPFTGLSTGAVNALYLGLFLVLCALIGLLALRAPRRPRLAQLVFLIVAVFLLVGKVWSQQFVLWLIPFAVLARPRWGAFLVWQFAEVGYFFAFYAVQVAAADPSRIVIPEWVFVLAAIARYVSLSVLCGFVVRDILHPGRDPVRADGDDDPDGGVFDTAPDVPFSWRPARAQPLTGEAA